ncbi:PH domain-containing protein [uncultured Microbacterium sp.]|jgi:Bacterial PH domain|uniref:PH domain-containing protein n=1 Tax=uncultured Microbacterium sp. TaxID=191216 RepID=UPI0025DE2D18|nr:PH domain-containing protein [uncultured Microbacterium sp.]
MTQPTAYGQPIGTPPPGVGAPERLVARFRGRAPGLFFSAIVLIASAGAVTFFPGRLPAPFTDLMLFIAAGVLVLLVVIVPWVRWLSHSYRVTTRRVIAQRGLFATRRVELMHARGYAMEVRRSPAQRLAGAGTIVLRNGVEPPLALRNIPDVTLVHEVLVDQIEVNQILAHRDAQTSAF